MTENSVTQVAGMVLHYTVLCLIERVLVSSVLGYHTQTNFLATCTAAKLQDK